MWDRGATWPETLMTLPKKASLNPSDPPRFHPPPSPHSENGSATLNVYVTTHNFLSRDLQPPSWQFSTLLAEG